jgi:hypothetical protein
MGNQHRYQLQIKVIQLPSKSNEVEERVSIIAVDTFSLGLLEIQLYPPNKFFLDPGQILDSFIEQFGVAPERVNIFSLDGRFKKTSITAWAEINLTKFQYQAPSQFSQVGVE